MEAMICALLEILFESDKYGFGSQPYTEFVFHTAADFTREPHNLCRARATAIDERKRMLG